jgi:hypothetical protein
VSIRVVQGPCLECRRVLVAKDLAFMDTDASWPPLDDDTETLTTGNIQCSIRYYHRAMFPLRPYYSVLIRLLQPFDAIQDILPLLSHSMFSLVHHEP